MPQAVTFTVEYVALYTTIRMATNLANPEYSGISLNMENSENSVLPQGKIVTN